MEFSKVDPQKHFICSVCFWQEFKYNPLNPLVYDLKTNLFLILFYDLKPKFILCPFKLPEIKGAS